MKHVLEIPWSKKDELKEKYNLKGMKGGNFIYSGILLPKELRNYKTEDFTLARWAEDEENAHVSTPENTLEKLSLYPHQLEAAIKINESYNNDLPGFILSDKQGLGKKLSSLSGITKIAQQKIDNKSSTSINKTKLLIVTNRSNIPTWRKIIQGYPIATAFLRILIIPYNQINKLLTPPPSGRIAPKKSVKNRSTIMNGIPTINWDFIIFDNAHELNNYWSNNNAKLASVIAKLNNNYIKNETPFVVFNTPTPGASPTDFAIMAKIIGPLINDKENLSKINPSLWGDFLITQKFHIRKVRQKYEWGLSQKEKENNENNITENMRQDSIKLSRALKQEKSPFLMRTNKTIPDWPIQKIISLPITIRGKTKYTTSWQNFSKWINLNPKQENKQEFLTKLKLFEIKNSELKIDFTIDFIIDNVKRTNQQLYIRVENSKVAKEYYEKLIKKRVPTILIKDHNQEDIRLLSESTVQVLIDNRINLTKAFNKDDFNNLPVIVIEDYFNASKSLQAINILFNKEQYSTIYIPYIENSLDEILLPKILGIGDINQIINNGKNINLIESTIRESAARTTRPNRLS